MGFLTYGANQMSKRMVEIKKGTFRGVDVVGTFEVKKPWKDTGASSYITVVTNDYLKGLAYNVGGSARIVCQLGDFENQDEDGNVVSLAEDGVTAIGEWERQYRETETEEEAHERIRRAFAVLSQITLACMKGTIRSAIIAGAPGVGKSYTVEETLKDGNKLRSLDADDEYEVIKGTLTPGYLFQVLYRHRHAGHVIVFDDCDKTFENPDSANLLKGALDTGNRTIQWGSARGSDVLVDRDGNEIEDRFTFEGSVLFLTNVNMNKLKDTKSDTHLKALRSRCLFIDLEVNDNVDMMRRVRQIMDQGLLKKYNLSKECEDEIFDFINENVDLLQELSLRTVLKVADLRREFDDQWKDLACQVVMKREAVFKRLVEQKEAASAAS